MKQIVNDGMKQIVNDGMKETVIPDLIGDLNMKTN